MSYYITTRIKGDFNQVIERVTEELKNQGFGVLTTIDMKATLKKKLDVDFYNYQILGACNPPNAYKALQAEDKIGLMLPCNVIVQEKEEGQIDVSAVDPVVSMMGVKNEGLEPVAVEVRDKLKKVIEALA
ncbi:DUF302 domain-containing protein [Algoriphagus winogradskyi]|jgi:uncharacterized protein (DUF302 family)|uniref:Uncharacterized conserved protein, DUF302 family n=1 Tax=Algoriphagus winogradskyi TaxID=237017 RepID=A0ABY1PHW3_9BACT|nr:DUF302 domain-containing protein [Algoriphagus winogradskyi]SMP34022.1 Uncharacterized conserved protein, DUF302 family [Algoriphagus winogradskyi]